jgi:hypothetical protein
MEVNYPAATASSTSSIANLLTVFGNIRVEGDQKYIDLEVTLASLKGSALSKVPWVLNLRGNFADKAENLIRKLFGVGPRLFRIEDDRGWHFVTNQLLDYVKTPMLYSFLEDHYYSGSNDSLCGMLSEMIAHSIDHLIPYRFSRELLFALEKRVPLVVCHHLSFVDLNQNSILARNAVLTEFSTLDNYDEYLIGLPGFFSLRFYRSRISAFKMGFAQYNEQTPFDFEQSSYNRYSLPIRFAYSKNEIFSCIDDDIKVPGTSLVSRGILSRNEKIVNPEVASSNEVSILKVQTSEKRSFLFKYSETKGRYAFLRPGAVSKTSAFVGSLSIVLRDHFLGTAGITHAVVIAGCAGFVPLIFLTESGGGLRLMAVEQQLDSHQFLLSNLELRKALNAPACDVEPHAIRYPLSKFDTPNFIAKVDTFLDPTHDSHFTSRVHKGLAVFIGDIYNYGENIGSLLWLISRAQLILISRPELTHDLPSYAEFHDYIMTAGFEINHAIPHGLINAPLFPNFAEAELPAVLVYSRANVSFP